MDENNGIVLEEKAVEETAETAEDVAAEEAVAETAPEAAENIENAEAEAEPEKPKKREKSEKKSFSFGAVMVAVIVVLTGAFKHVKRCARVVFSGLCSFLSYIGSSAWRILSYAAVAAFFGAIMAAKNVSASLSRHAKLILPALGRFLYYLGHSAWSVLAAIAKAVFSTVFSVLKAVFGTVSGWLSKKFKQPLYDVWCFILTPFAHAYGAVAHAHIRLKKAKKRGFIPALNSALSSFWHFLGGIGEFLRFAFNYVAPVISIIFLISLIRYASTLQYAISVEYNGSEIGTIDSEATAIEAQSLINDKVTFTEDDQPIISTTKFYVTVLNLSDTDEPINDIDTLSEIMIEGGDVPIVYAYGLYINDDLIGVYAEEDMEIIRSAFNDKINQYTTPDAVDVRFEDDIVILEERFLETSLVSADSALELINGATRVEAYYVVERGDTISKICSKLGITQEEFAADNPLLNDGVSRGDIVTYHYLEPHLNVITTHYEHYGQVIQRVTQYEESSRYEQYCERLVQHGSDGYENVTALIVETNGVETERNIVSRTVLEEMVPRVFRVGTKENTYIGDDTDILETLGTFVWPLARHDGYISSLFGYRSWDSSNHRAVDIAGIPRGTDIYAACDGTVTHSGWFAGYGKLVIIDHGHGYETYYAHCSELLVEVGDKVEKGDIIAEVGATGNASGNHLHFEVRHYDQKIDPLIALGGTGGHEIRL